MLKLSVCRDAIHPLKSENFRELEITGISNHSGRVAKGFLFCAIRGSKEDGRRFLSQAIQSGAAAIVSDDPNLEFSSEIPHLIVENSYHAWGILCETFYGFPARTIHLHAITGTNGKTTTAFLLRKLIAEATGEKCGLISTIEYDVCAGAPPRESARTTPDAMGFQEIMRDMAEHKCVHAVMETSSHGLHQKRTGNAHFDTAVFTNLTGDHLDYHHDMESYYQAKKILFSELLAPSCRPVVNVDDSWGRRLADELTKEGKKPVTLSARDPHADGFIQENRSSAKGSVFTLKFGEKSLVIETSLIGLHNLYNLSSAALAALVLGIAPGKIVKILKEPFAVPGRLEAFHLPNGSSAFVDYAHTDDALERVLGALRPLTKGKLIVVFGCGGDRDRTKRPRMAEVCGRLADLTIITSDNPRTEPPESIIRDAEAGMPQGKAYLKITDRKEAIHKAVNEAEKNDLILIAGKGHETYQEIDGVRYPFDDREILRALIDSNLCN